MFGPARSVATSAMRNSSTRYPSSLANCIVRIFFALAVVVAPPQAIDAGDILRGGATFGTAPTANQTGGANVALSSRATTSGQDSLARAAQALQAVKAMQVAGHDA